MKTLFKIIITLLILSFVSCTENQEIVTKDGKIIQENLSSVSKQDVSNPNNDGNTGEDLYDEE